jgi:para-aminobenzoate synthetase component I
MPGSTLQPDFHPLERPVQSLLGRVPPQIPLTPPEPTTAARVAPGSPTSTLTPAAAVAGWPATEPLAALVSGGLGGSWGRWSILARPTQTIRAEGLDEVLRILGDIPVGLAGGGGGGVGADAEAGPFTGGWLVSISFEAGMESERAALGSLANDGRPGGMSCILQRCPAAHVHDQLTGHWHAAGDPASRAALPELHAPRIPAPAFTLSTLRSTTGRDRFVRQVEAAQQHIQAGDIYQVNLAHILEGRFTGSARSFFSAVLASAQPRYSAYLEFDGGAIVSGSPELFLEIQPAGRIVTRPMKGTRPAHRQAELDASDKERAELTMIVDLLRNDLGRVCSPGSVKVESLRGIERHGCGTGELAQAVATVSGQLEGASLAQVLRAVLPAGSVTGAPKLRAIQILANLEPERRGAYCGVIGYIGDDGRLGLSVAIRTAVIGGVVRLGEVEGQATLRYGVGAGIVADSRPDEEWAETVAKAGWLLGLSAQPDADGGVSL